MLSVPNVETGNRCKSKSNHKHGDVSVSGIVGRKKGYEYDKWLGRFVMKMPL